MKKLDTKLKIIISAVVPIVLIIIASIIASVASNNFVSYGQGMISLDSGDYLSAYFCFNNAGDYKDAEVLKSFCSAMDPKDETTIDDTLKLCNKTGKSLDKKYVYDWALTVYENKNYDYGYDYFVALGDYKDSEEKVDALKKKYPYYFNDVNLGDKVNFAVKGNTYTFTAIAFYDGNKSKVAYLCDSPVDYVEASSFRYSDATLDYLPNVAGVKITDAFKDYYDYSSNIPKYSSMALKDASGKSVKWWAYVYHGYYSWYNEYYYVNEKGEYKELNYDKHSDYKMAVRPAFWAEHHVDKNIEL